MPPKDENPFENVPVDGGPPPEKKPPRVDPFQGRASWEREGPPAKPAKPGKPRKPLKPPAASVRSRLALGAGFGVFFVAVVFYIAVGLIAQWELQAVAFAVVGVLLSAAIPYLFMAEHLTIRPKALQPIHTKFLAGLLLAVLAALLLALFVSYAPDLVPPLGLIALLVMTWVSVTLLLYSLFTRAPA